MKGCNVRLKTLSMNGMSDENQTAYIWVGNEIFRGKNAKKPKGFLL